LDEGLREYLDEYLAELEEQIENLQEGLMTLETEPQDQPTINEVFRITHTIKGNAGTMGFGEIQKIGHVMEDLLDTARSGGIVITSDMVDVMLKGNDAIKTLKEAIITEESVDVGLEQLVRDIGVFLESRAPTGPRSPELKVQVPQATQPPPPPAKPIAAGELPRPVVTAPAAPGEIRYYIDLVFDPDMPMKSVRAFLVLTKLRDFGVVLESMPTTKEVEQNCNFDVLLIKYASSSPLAKIETVLSFGESKDVNLRLLPADKADSPLSSLTAWVHSEETDLEDLLDGDFEQDDGTPSPAVPAPPSPAVPAPPERAKDLPPLTVAPAPVASPTAPKISHPEVKPPAVPTLPPKPIPTPPARLPDPVEPPPRTVGSTRQLRLPEDAAGILQQLTEDQKERIGDAISRKRNVYIIDLRFISTQDDCYMRARTITARASEYGTIYASFPSSSHLSAGGFEGRLILLLGIDRPFNDVKKHFTHPEVESVDEILLKIEGIKILPDRHEDSKDRSKVGKRESAESEAKRSPPITVRVGVDRLNSLMNLVGELVIAKTQFVQSLSQYQDTGDFAELEVAVQSMNQKLTVITNALQQGIMKVRMVQIGQVFFRFSRMVRDLSKVLGKQVEFIMDGTETELDKTVIDQIGDPLMHLIRNSLDHGIESPEVRQAMGKRGMGILKLAAQQIGDHIIVEVIDDGGGLDIERIKEKALKNNVVSAQALKQMSPQEIYALIFQPGFSTAETVTNISGRGVGMDVVKRAFDNLGGDIQIKSEKNMGTTVQIKIPLTLAIIQGLMVRVADQCFAIPLSTVKESILLQRHMLHVINNHKVAKYRDEVIPLIYLEDYFELDGPKSDKNFIVFAGDDDNKIGLVVNSLIGRREIVIKSLDKRFIDVKGFAGATILGDGTVSLILDVPSLVEDARGQFI